MITRPIVRRTKYKPVYKRISGILNGTVRKFRLSLGEHVAYAAAIMRGYLVLRINAPGETFEAYLAWCYKHKRPFVVIERDRRTYHLRAFLHPTGWWLTERTQEQIRNLMRLGAWTRGYVERGEILYSGIPKRSAYEIAERLLDILYVARHDWNRQQARTSAGEGRDG